MPRNAAPILSVRRPVPYRRPAPPASDSQAGARQQPATPWSRYGAGHEQSASQSRPRLLSRRDGRGRSIEWGRRNRGGEARCGYLSLATLVQWSRSKGTLTISRSISNIEFLVDVPYRLVVLKGRAEAPDSGEVRRSLREQLLRSSYPQG